MRTIRCRYLWFLPLLAVLGLFAVAGPREVERVFAEIVLDSHQPSSPAKQHRLLEADLNAYVAQRLREQRPPGVQEIAVGLQGNDRVATRMLVDVDQAGLANGSGVSGLLGSLMSGTQRLEFEGLLSSGEGMARYQIESVRLNGFPIPVAVVETLLESWGNRMQPPIDFDEPFQLPYRIQKIGIGKGFLVIFTGS